ncbi:chemotaxis protein CheW [Geomonas oryzae]|uniref:chemotaxis protein CheW n=1 Tax=Geomonas oryzae TaxID=2364273 RepID=UPI001FE79B95|nr:chemotaxis protein CheW [Geomonas oryzae]
MRLNPSPEQGTLERRIDAANWRRPIDTIQLLIFTLDDQRYALRLDHVKRVVRAAALTQLPKAPDVVMGILDLHGEIVPVINLRRRFKLPERPVASSDQFVIARTGRLTLALVVDGSEGVIEPPSADIVAADEIVAGDGFVAGVTRTADGLVLIHDLDALLFPHEEEQIAAALART